MIFASLEAHNVDPAVGDESTETLNLHDETAAVGADYHTVNDGVLSVELLHALPCALDLLPDTCPK